ncbi:MAG TPA: thioesterase family protein [Vicinamibacterales bacterium]|nr:thioesterase family protein [Vicinamibacterales bacterium]
MVSEHHLRRRVQFYETDMAGLVHFTWFFRYMEEAEHALWRAAGLSIAEQGSHVGWPRVSASFEFYSPLRFEDEFDVHLRITAMTAGRIHYRCVLWKGETRIAEGALEIACVRRNADGTISAREIPPEVRAALSAAEEL